MQNQPLNLPFITMFKEAWGRFWGNFGFIFLSGLVMVAVTTALSVATRLVSGPDGSSSNVTLELLLQLLTSGVSAIFGVGITRAFLAIVRGQKPQWSFFQTNIVKLTLYSLVASILYSLIIWAGFLLLLIPGIIWSIQFGFVQIALVDLGLGPIAALKQSSKLTKNIKRNLLLFSSKSTLILLAPMPLVGATIFAISTVLSVMGVENEVREGIVALIAIIGIGGSLVALAGPVAMLQYMVYERLQKRLESTQETQLAG